MDPTCIPSRIETVKTSKGNMLEIVNMYWGVLVQEVFGEHKRRPSGFKFQTFYAHMLMVVACLVINLFSCLIITRHHGSVEGATSRLPGALSTYQGPPRAQEDRVC